MTSEDLNLPLGAAARLYKMIAMFGALFIFFVLMPGQRPLGVPDEARYSEISREMAVSGDYVTPRLNGVKYFEKPPLFYWLEALSIRLFGLSEWALRLWPALFAFFGCMATYGAATGLFGRRAGLFSALVLATSLLYYALSRLVILDMPVSVFLTASLFAFLLSVRERDGWKRSGYLYGFYIFSALAVLTKGLIGIAIPAIVIGSWMAIMREWRLVRNMRLLSGIVVFIVIVAPWHVIVSRENPEFFNFYFIHEHFQRYLTTVHHHYKPFWFFMPVLLLGLFPWSVFIYHSIKFNMPRNWGDRLQHRETLFLLLWAGIVFIFFSASSSKLVPYILPALPPFAVLIGRYLADAWERRGVFRKAIPAIVATMMVFYVVANAAASGLDKRSIKTLADVLKPRLNAGDEVVSYQTYYYDLPVYIERRITVVDWKGELKFGAAIEDTSGWMISDTEFWRRWQGPSLMYMLTTRNAYDELRREPKRSLLLILIGGTERDVLISNGRNAR